MYSKDIYDSWKIKQAQKYEQLTPLIKEHLKKVNSVIDIGVGPAWIYDHMGRFQRIVGVDADENMMNPKRSFIEYHVSSDFKTEERFDLLICFDALHLIEKPEKLINYVKKDRLALISVPLRFKNLLNQFTANKQVLIEGTIGEEEKDYFALIKNG